MLCLSRTVQQSIVIGKDIRITITKLEGKRVTVGIDAPNDVRILREEILEREEKLEHIK